MLGERIGQEQGRVTSRRILPGDDYRYVKMEITVETQCTILGQEATNIGTYTVFERVADQIYGEGQGIIMTKEGEGAIWRGHGVGHASADGSITFAASVAFQAAPGGKLAKLNAMLVLVEHTAGGDGSASSNLYAWTA